jgi:hypothetical protein
VLKRAAKRRLPKAGDRNLLAEFLVEAINRVFFESERTRPIPRAAHALLNPLDDHLVLFVHLFEKRQVDLSIGRINYVFGNAR